MATAQNTRRRAPGQPPVSMTCLRCGVRFLAPAADIRRRGRKYCGIACRSTGRARSPLADRLAAKTVKAESGCWVWTGTTNEKGYGLINDGRRKTVSTHRAAWIIANGPIPENAHVLHRCDNPPCVNPAHLFLGDNVVNQQDSMSKGRKYIPRGERHGRTHLTDALVISARQRYAAGQVTSRELVSELGVNKSTVTRILNRRMWRHSA